MRSVTALHPERRDRVRVELDGEPWRTLPAAAVVAAGLRSVRSSTGERARSSRRALRRVEALDAAGRRPGAARPLRGRARRAVCRARGVRPSERAYAVETLVRLGYVDDERFAADRALGLAVAGLRRRGDPLRPRARGIGAELIAAAIEQTRAGGRAGPSDRRPECGRPEDGAGARGEGLLAEAIEEAMPVWPD